MSVVTLEQGRSEPPNIPLVVETVPDATNQLPGKRGLSVYHFDPLEMVLWRFNHLEINRGCGRRPCCICSNNAPLYQESMPFDDVEAVFGYLGENENQYPSINLWDSGDPIYYLWERKNLADLVLTARKDYGVRLRPIIPTHGYVVDEEYPHEAMGQLIDAIKTYPDLFKEFEIELAIDPYGWIGIDDQLRKESLARIFRLFQTMHFDQFSLILFYNNLVRLGPGSFSDLKSFVGDISDMAGFSQEDLVSHTRARIIIAAGRASQLKVPLFQQIVSLDSLPMGVLAVNGDVLWHWSNPKIRGSLIDTDIAIVGNIHNGSYIEKLPR